ncbi:MAG TPA: epimerase [bacterium]|nr:epimerase [bacterium]
MKVILFGGSGMVGQGVLLECLRDDRVTAILSIGRGNLDRGPLTRAGLSAQTAKLREVVHKDFADYSSLEGPMTGYDACFFCLGVSSAGMSEADYRHISFDYTLAAGRLLARLNPGMTFTYVSGVGTDSTEKGGMMWARVKGATENALLSLPFKGAYMFRPGAIVPMDGIVPRNKWLKAGLVVLGPLFALLKKLMPNSIVTTREIGRAMIRTVVEGYPKKWLEPSDIVQRGRE